MVSKKALKVEKEAGFCSTIYNQVSRLRPVKHCAFYKCPGFHNFITVLRVINMIDSDS